MSPSGLHTLTLTAWIVIFISMLVIGALLLIFGRVKIGNFRIRGITVRITGLVILLGSGIFYYYNQRGFMNQFGLFIQAILLFAGLAVLWIRAEKPAPHQPLPPAIHTSQSKPDETPYRLHLRLNKDGSGILVVNAATVLHLNPSAAEFAYHMIKGTSPEDVGHTLAKRYRSNDSVIQKDYLDFRDRVQTLIHTPDLDPTTFLDFERVAPHSQDLTAPLRLDCALTYRLPVGTQAEYAPTKRVDRELTTSEWQTVLEKAWAFGIPHVTFTGGEPTLRDDLPELISSAEKIGQVTGLLSDGLKLLDKKYFHTLQNAGLDHLLFILQPENKASWDALGIILPDDLYTTVHLTITPENRSEARGYIDRLSRMGANSLSLGASDDSLLPILHEFHDQAAASGLTLRWDLPVPYSQQNPVAHETREDEIPSGAGKSWLYVEPDGDVLPTQGAADKILGNVLRDPWEKIYSPG